MQNGRVVKGVQFVDIRDAGDPVECAKAYCEAGADELAMLDITATIENRPTLVEVIKRTAAAVTVPFSVGGGIRDVASAEIILSAGADKVSTSSAAFRKPEVIADMVKRFGSRKIIVAVDVAVNETLPSGYEVFIDGGQTATGADAIEWIKRIDGYGVGAVLPTSKTADGVKCGYALPLIRMTREAVSKGVDVVASGGAGTLEHFKEAADAGANILLAASVFHFKTVGIRELKEYLRSQGVNVAGVPDSSASGDHRKDGAR
jgi:cyclase